MGRLAYIIIYTNNINYVLPWKSYGLSNLKISSIQTTNYLLNPYLNTYNNNNKIRIKFYGSFLNRFPPSICHGKIVNIHIAYEITNFHDIENYPTLTNALFGSVKLTKNADKYADKYKYSGYGTGFDGKGFFQLVMN